MERIYTTSVSAETFSEAPMAYESLHDIVYAIKDSAEIIGVMKPL